MAEDVIYLEKDDVLGLYMDMFAITEQQANAALMQQGLLESALASPRNHAMYDGADMVEQAAYLGYAIANNHAFQDGNKRTAGLAVQTFLEFNNLTLTCSDDDLASWIIDLTLGASAESFAACLRPFVQPLGT